MKDLLFNLFCGAALATIVRIACRESRRAEQRAEDERYARKHELVLPWLRES